MTPPNQGAWDGTPSRNLLLPENLDLVRQELAGGGIIFGWHYYYAGGRSADMFCFSGYDAYYQALQNSRPGDHFTVYSRQKLLNKAILRLGDPGSGQRIASSSPAEIENALTRGEEIVFLWCQAPRATGSIECEVGVLRDLAEQEFADWLELQAGRGGELLFFTTGMLDQDEDGRPVSTVSPGAKRRVNALLDGKRPHESGLTPASGPY